MKWFLRFFFLMSLCPLMLSAQNEVLIADFETSIPNTYYYAPGGTATVVDNPYVDARNGSAKVLRFDKSSGTYKLIGFGFPDLQIKVKDVKQVEFLIYGENFNSLYVSTENTLDPRTSEIHKIWAKPYGTSNVWYKVTVPLNKPDPQDTLGYLGYLNIFPNMEDAAQATFYIDSVKLVLFPTGVGVESVTVDPKQVELIVNEKRLIEAQIEPEDADNKNVTWASTDADVATVDATGMVTAVSAGSAKIYVTTEDGGFTDTCYVTVTDVIPEYPPVIANFEDVVPSDAPGSGVWQVFSWNGSREIIPNPVKDENNNTDNLLHYTKDAGATWSGFGFFYQDGIYTTPDLESLELMLYGVQWTKLFVKVEGIKNGTPATFYETPWPWAPPSTAGSWNKIVIPFGPNLAGSRIKNILVMCADVSDPFEVYVDQVKLNYKVSVESVALNKTTLELAVGAEEYLEAIITPANASNQNVTWESSNTAVATVNSLGKVVAVAPGTATITVTTEDGAKTATCEVTVIQTGIHSTTAKQNYLYPNPVTGSVLYVAVPSAVSGTVQFRIMDVSGRIVQSFSSPVNGSRTYQLSVRLVPGNYLLKVTGEGVNDMMKLIVK
ncbi:MAG: T9SS type A sorting domain-containing protein [Bacteroidales bacterium]|nr:T9SS type A sorting domain-containing protein [Bacteroidales bacterium]